MESSQFYLGDWQVSPASNSLRLGKTLSVVEPKAMDVLLLLCQQAGEVVSADTLVEQCWGAVAVGDNPVHKAITQLRKALGDRATQPIYIETIRKRGYRIIADVVFPRDDQARAEKSQWQGGSPFLGLNAFSDKDAGIFFGRQSQIEELLQRLNSQVRRNHGFLLLLGASGSGKSSLIHAGLIPRLTAATGVDGLGVVSVTSTDFADVSAMDIWQSIASALLDWEIDAQPVFCGFSAQSLALVLQTDIEQVCNLCQQAIKAHPQYRTARLMLVLDRLEVLLDSPQFSDEDRQGMTQLIDALARCQAVIVVTACRNDFYPLLANYPALMRGKDHGSHFDLAPPSPHELSQMIRLPAIAAQLTWGKDTDTGMPLDEVLVLEAASQPDALPLLQYTLQELYEQRNENQLQASVYRELGGIEGAIGHKAEEIFKGMSANNQQAFSEVMALLVTLSHDASNLTSRTARWQELNTPAQRAFVQTMVDNRLFVSHLQDQQACFRLAHEALLRRWSRVSDWISQHKDSLAIRSQLHQQAQSWLAENRSSAYLLADGKPLQEAQRLLHNRSFTLLDHEQALIRASQTKVRNRRWLKRGTVTLLALLTCISVFMTLQSQHAQHLAEQKRQEAEGLLGFMVGEFADKLRSVKRMDLLDGISGKAVEYFSASDEQTDIAPWWLLFDLQPSNEARFQRALTLQALAEVAYSRGNNEEARQSFTAAERQLVRLLDTDVEQSELLTMLGANAFWRAQLDYDAGHYERAKPILEAYLHYSQRLLAIQPQDSQAQLELSYAHNSLGSLAVKQQRYQQALTSFRHSLALKIELAEADSKNVALLADIADTYSWLASVARHLGDANAALKYFTLGKERLQQALDVQPDNAYTLESMALVLWQHANLRELTGDIRQATALASNALHYLDKLTNQDPQNAVWQDDKRKVQLLLIRLSTLIEETDTGYAPNETDALLTRIFTENTLTDSDYLTLAFIYHQQNRTEAKQKALYKSRDWLDTLNPDSSISAAIFHAQYQLLQAFPVPGNPDQSAPNQHCENARELLLPHARISKDAQLIQLLMATRQCSEEQPLADRQDHTLSPEGISASPYFH
ncbi:winged helix-turn-helix domain-containing protein [Lacimicrobium sp. SS2-24]|uniref:nSTAND1 domain-containing NTPase n=1 Tax=Lacimicrobium sp. SS2-24 TaxID=2005569 RepID=UPI000B4A8BB3|nr:winged helix-turn-helix domain-containing protein [Lacimicrobium sp. SS2-24]